MRLAWLAIAGALTFACTSKSPVDRGGETRPAGDALEKSGQDGEPMMGATTCKDAVEALVSGDLATWRGWPSGCSLADVEATIDLEPGITNTVSGKEALPTSHRAAAVDGLGEPLYIWFRGDSVVKASVQYPVIKDVAGLLAALGKPTIKLDTYFSSVPTVNPESEWVYAERGLALFMSSDKSNVVAVSLFPPTTEERYRAELYIFEPPREHP